MTSQKPDISAANLDIADYYAPQPLYGLHNLGQYIRATPKSKRVNAGKPGRKEAPNKPKPKTPPQCRGCNKTLAHGNARWCSEACRAATVARRQFAALDKTLPRTGARRNCACCGAEFIRKTVRHLYCSDACRMQMIHAKEQQRNKPKNPRKLYLCDIRGQKVELRKDLLREHARRTTERALKKLKR